MNLMGAFQLKILYDFHFTAKSISFPKIVFWLYTLQLSWQIFQYINNISLCYFIKSQDTLCRHSAAHLTPTTQSYKCAPLVLKTSALVRSRAVKTIFRDMLICLESQNGLGTVKIIKFQPPPPKAGKSSSRPSYSGPHPAWLCRIPGMGHPQPLWATSSRSVNCESGDSNKHAPSHTLALILHFNQSKMHFYTQDPTTV